ncbi:hypothetical protein PR048_015536 [Dryococelus australis]|uniref:DDE Tnp4 domain-containing protein n=1 Tax=Dryococelus australis TaxID=614101 RepID=A0ABQ9HH78_9NEOP|nr:hypothetical protein PR048_015536 [Dryococelus australis]
MVACDADSCFTVIEVGHAGRDSDGGVLKASRIGRWLQREGNRLHLPSDQKLANDESGGIFKFYFVADEAFPIGKNMLRPYPRKGINNRKRVFNYRLSRGRKSIGCTFGMMASKFAVLSTPISSKNVATANNIIHAVCVLRNFIRTREVISYRPTYNFDDHANEEHLPEELEEAFQEAPAFPQRLSGTSFREYISYNFLKPNTSIPFQWKYYVQ